MLLFAYSLLCFAPMAAAAAMVSAAAYIIDRRP